MAILERDFQKQVIKFLKEQGCVVLKYEQNATTRSGVADVFFCKDGFYGFVECKRAKNAPLRPGQKEFIEKMSAWSYGKIVYPENFDITKDELKELLR